ncbi:type VI secretion system baseplate subunit TssE [Zooshikella harenae]|uniref:Type VI secretion system baseplate subunit TssE n=1 Tax=Zooshikella harenae TaxID=2827238 RepID=A0ABS5ZAW0_9GAMM|nr:type VI secretion system baseplate subunit TssE [Zooshikella harenae]MBU2711202.1 type VI secretion system baseplate subunit TssE [Zooshikella harenae]
MRYLLERLDVLGEITKEDVLDLVIENITRLLSVVPATVNSPIDILHLGLPAVADLATNHRSQLQEIADRIKKIILTFEPRLQHVEVSLTDQSDPLNPFSLRINAQLVWQAQSIPVQFSLPASARKGE